MNVGLGAKHGMPATKRRRAKKAKKAEAAKTEVETNAGDWWAIPLQDAFNAYYPRDIKYEEPPSDKHDAGKPRWSLLPTDVLWGIVDVLEYGAKKYEVGGWMNTDQPITRYKDAMARHWKAIEEGEELDLESGLPHVYHFACNALFLAWHMVPR